MKDWVKKLQRFFVSAITVALVVFNLYMLMYIYRELAYVSQGISVITYYLTDLKSEIYDAVKRDTEIIGIINKIIDDNINTKKDMIQLIKDIKKYIDTRDLQKTQLTRELELKLTRCNNMIINVTQGFQGSGSVIRYKDKFYVISAGHLIEAESDILALYEQGKFIVNLEVVKVDKEHDLLLLKPIDENFTTNDFTTIANIEPEKTTNVYVIGNPVGIEDVLSEAKIIRYTDTYVYFIDHSYFGSSGGGVYNKDGELIGVISHMMLFPSLNTSFVIHGAVRLDQISIFMKDI